MVFDPYKEDLPIVDVFDSVKKELNQNNSLILTAPPGAGKSTLLPIVLLNEPWLAGKKILMLEPRRLAAKGIANRLADLIREQVGETVGYRIRFETKTSSSTRIEILTEGILTRILQNDNALEDVGLVIFDEFHERSIHADTALALTRETQAILREDLRILIMSATINTENLTKLLNAPLVESKGRQYPVDIIYTGDYGNIDTQYTAMAEATAGIVLKALKNHDGDILVFLPGEKEITDCSNILRKKTDKQNIVIQELYGKLPQSKQQAAIRPNKEGKRKVVIATSIAETSLTIQGIKVVVDSGLGRISKFDPRSGLSGLRTIRISQDSANQRAGRAGRLEAGTCYRMWSKGTQVKLSEHRTPEIIEADLTPLVLNLANWGINDPNQLLWVDPPPEHAVKKAISVLEDLEAIENNGITDHGKEMNKLPTHPRIAHMLLVSTDEDLIPLATDLAAILEERDPLSKEAGIDITLRIEGLRRYRSNNSAIHGGKFGKIERIANQYRRIMNSDFDNSGFDPYEVGLLLVHAFPERIAFARPGNNAQFQLANGSHAMAGHKDDLAHEPWLAIANLNDRETGTGKIFLAAPLNPIDLAPFVREIDRINWNNKKGGLIAVTETRIGNIVLKSVPIDNPDTEMIQIALLKAIKRNGKSLLNFDKEAVQWQNRINSLQKWNVDERQDWPNVSTNALLQSAEKWLSPYLANVKKPEDFKKINLGEVLQYSLTPKQQQLLEELAPSRITVPSGSSIRLEYQTNGSAPILPVRIQEIFGMSQTPTVNAGKVNVLMHLLSPGFKLVQTTSDLESFWENTYFEIKKELQIRYKKHAWPEAPKTHPPLRGAKRRNRD